MDYVFHFEIPLRSFSMLAYGAVLTIFISILSVIAGTFIGVLGALGRISRNKLLFIASSAYVELFRNTPFLLQLYFVYFILSSAGLNLEPTTAGVLALSINVGAYITEIIRAGIQSINKNQKEAGYSLGMTYMQCFRWVILPPALKNIAPALSNQFIATVLASSIVSVIAAKELAYAASILEARTYRSFEIYLIVIIMYFILVEGFSVLLRYVNRKAFRS